jgi:hypothetical protein
MSTLVLCMSIKELVSWYMYSTTRVMGVAYLSMTFYAGWRLTLELSQMRMASRDVCNVDAPASIL